VNHADAVALCVVRVERGPGGVSWALVSVNLDPETDPSAVERSRHLDSDAVLVRVAAFLQDAGMTGRQDAGAPGRETDLPPSGPVSAPPSPSS
jgi:hypothetical protein